MKNFEDREFVIIISSTSNIIREILIELDLTTSEVEILRVFETRVLEGSCLLTALSYNLLF
jgi:hypothetical protein